jgi:glycosyltransferase involved in cell wall biosynthesis
MHDAAVFAVPETYSLAFRTYCRTLMRRLGRVAARIITDSAFSRDELIRHLHVHDMAIRVVPLGGDHMNSIPPDTSVLAKHDLTRRPFVLAAGSISPNKNFRSIAEAAKLLNGLDFDVVIAGGACKVFNRSAGCLPNCVKQLGYMSDGELRALYEHAACFVFPSFYEGFGLPPLEAMACGCPVIVSNAASLPEVCGDAALYCDPHSPEDIADKITSLMSDDALRGKLRHAGFERAAMYTWDNCARLTVKVLEEALAQ